MAVAEHTNLKDHNINFNKVKILNKKQNYRKIMIKEAMEIEKCLTNFNRENGWKISNTWKTLSYKRKRKKQWRQQEQEELITT